MSTHNLESGHHLQIQQTYHHNLLDMSFLSMLLEFPDPVIKLAIDIDKMGASLVKLAQEDHLFHFSRDEEVNQTMIEGMGELHLEIIADHLKRELKVETNVGAP
ncbi:hypothetical protein ACLB2K_045984 [Fragaria x ananassa]